MSADIQIKKPHSLSHAKAKQTAQKMADDLNKEFGLECEWDGDVLHFERPGVSGHLKLGKSELDIAVKLGLLMRPFKSSIHRAIEDHLTGLQGEKKSEKKSPKKA